VTFAHNSQYFYRSFYEDNNRLATLLYWRFS